MCSMFAPPTTSFYRLDSLIMGVCPYTPWSDRAANKDLLFDWPQGHPDPITVDHHIIPLKIWI